MTSEESSISPLHPEPDLDTWLAPESDNFFTNARGLRIHFRYWLPPSGTAARAVVHAFHGLTAHVNAPRFHAFAERLAAAGLVVIAPDFHGHGYSAGERCLVWDGAHLNDEAMAMVRLFSGPPVERPEHHVEAPLGEDDALRKRIAELPFFLAGGSLGGGAAIHTGAAMLKWRKDPEAKAEDKALATLFRGEVLLAPATQAVLPPAVLIWFLRCFVVPFWPRAQLPGCIDKATDDALIWTEPEVIACHQEDPLRYMGRMRYATGLALLDWIGSTQAALPSINYPFLIFHDPEDAIIPFEGSMRMMQQVATQDRWKRLRVCEGLRHDIITNDVALISTEAIAFVNDVLENR